MKFMRLKGPIWPMQPIPYFGEKLKGGWIFEPKIDGWRLQLIRLQDGRAELWGRRLERRPNWTERLSQIAKEVKELFPCGILLDCELYTEKGRRFISSVFAAKPKVQPIVYIFDVVFYENRFVGSLPLRRRLEILKKLKLGSPFHLLDHEPLGDLGQALESAVKKGHEGIVIKRLNSPYQISKDGPIAAENWRKIKP